MYILRPWPAQRDALSIPRPSSLTLVPPIGLEKRSISSLQLRSDDSPPSDTVVGVIVGVLLGVFVFIITVLLWLRGRRRQTLPRRGQYRRRRSHHRPARRLPTALLNGRRYREYDRVEGRRGKVGGRGGAGLPGHAGCPGQIGLPVSDQGHVASGHAGEPNSGLSGLGGGGRGGPGRVEMEDSDEGSVVRATGGSGAGGEGRGGIGGYGGPGGRGGDGGVGGRGGAGSAHAQASASVYTFLMCCVLAPQVRTRRPVLLSESPSAAGDTASQSSASLGGAPIPARPSAQRQINLPQAEGPARLGETGGPVVPRPIYVVGQGGRGLGGVGRGGHGGQGGLGGQGGEGGRGGGGGFGEAAAEAVTPTYALFVCCIFSEPREPRGHRAHRTSRDPLTRVSRMKGHGS
ncbi:hypothetical protein GGR51DRAFT_573293 [Nemania sp. FL0031]|nr:hypothetical protein GGR51DRAFT_573293 [Nemania sp. FL0031]